MYTYTKVWGFRIAAWIIVYLGIIKGGHSQDIGSPHLNDPKHIYSELL